MTARSSELITFLTNKGFKAQVTSVSHVAELQSLFDTMQQTGEISAEFYPEITRYFDFNFQAALPEARSIIIVASPQPPTTVLFAGRPATIPPTYVSSDIWKEQLRVVKEFLASGGYQVARARLPFKTLAVRSGLGKYGRNNVCYIAGMGSFHRLGAFYSNLPCEEDAWGAPQSMKICRKCTECMQHCPTKCISAERFLIHADRCLTHFNESEKPLPDWVKPSWHNALLGCMVCQSVCPLNEAFLTETQDAPLSFTEEETFQILAGAPLEKLAQHTREKLDTLCLSESDVYPLLARNLSLLRGQFPV